MKQTTKDSEDKQKIDSTIESEQYVEYDVQNFDFLNEQEDIDEIYNSYNSEISFFTSVDSVNDNWISKRLLVLFSRKDSKRTFFHESKIISKTKLTTF